MTTLPESVGHLPKRPESTMRAPYQDIDKLRNAYGMVAIISQRLSNGMVTFSIFREFERDGEIARTAFIPEDLADVFLDFSKLVVERVREIRNELPPVALKAAIGT
jgi:hypothetical protein